MPKFEIDDDIAAVAAPIADRLKLTVPPSLKLAIAAGGLLLVEAHWHSRSVNGFIAHVTRESVDRIAGVEGFAIAMEAVGQLEVTPDGVRVLRFKGEDAASRARRKAAERQQRLRDRRASERNGQRDASVTSNGDERDEERDERDATVTQSVTRNASPLTFSEKENEVQRSTLGIAHGEEEEEEDPQDRAEAEATRQAWQLNSLLELAGPVDAAKSFQFYDKASKLMRGASIDRAISETRALIQARQIKTTVFKTLTSKLLSIAAADGVDLRRQPEVGVLDPSKPPLHADARRGPGRRERAA